MLCSNNFSADKLVGVIVVYQLALNGLCPFENTISVFNSLRPGDASVTWVIIGSDNGLSHVRRQAIWTNAELFPINVNENLSEIQKISFKKINLKMSTIFSRYQYIEIYPCT